MTRRLTAGSPEPLGATLDARGLNVAVFSHHAEAIEVCLFDTEGERERERIRLPERTGDVFHGHIADLPAGTRYGLRAYGPYAPHLGHRFNPQKLLIDPYAVLLDRPFRLHPAMFGYTRGDAQADLSYDERDSAPSMPKAIVAASTPARLPGTLRIPWAETILYELNVRGFSKRNQAIAAPLRGTFAGLAHPVSIEHLKKLGVTSVEIMPAAAWIDERHLADLGLTNYWGYNPIAYGAPDPRLAPGGWDEIRGAVEALQAAGLEVIVDVVLNHSGEGDELGPTLSLRGLDNASYYRLRPGEARRYIDDAGCGNCLATERLPVVRLAMDALRTWASRAGVDGFRFDLATTIARRPDGFDPAAAFLAAIAQDPQLRGLKLIAEPWDIGPGGYRLGAFPSGWGEWNDKFRDGVRRFWRGDGGLVGELATRLAGSSDVFGAKTSPSRSVNFIVAHDGFTLADLVAYERKHNEANGEHNRDGTEANLSWNHGVEGPTDRAEIREARRRDERNLLATLLLARGTPMLAMGSEFGHSQHGNNNAYAQDNETSWLDWAAADTSLETFCQNLIGLRRQHAALRQDVFLTGRPPGDGLFADVEWRNGQGRPMSEADWHNPSTDTLVAVLCAPQPPDAELDRVMLILHRGRGIDVPLPEPRDGFGWIRLLDTAAKVAVPAEFAVVVDWVAVAERSVVLLGEAPEPEGRRPSKTVEPALLASLSRAAGIADHWWDVAGARYNVTSETQRTLLSAMGLRSETQMQARESLALLSARNDRRAIPAALVSREGERVEIRLACDSGRPYALHIEREDGRLVPVRLTEANCREIRFQATDGRDCRGFVVHVPPQPVGRHRVWREDLPDLVCHLTIAPPRCHLPPAIARGTRFFGIAAHLYTLRRSGDQGIGDFTSLGRLGELAAAQGAATIGLNPLHALFPREADRTSPYHPSDRRFLDWIYIDVAAPSGLPLLEAGDAAIAAGLAAKDDVDYVGVRHLKSAILERRFAGFADLPPDHPLVREFEQFAQEGGAALQRFAAFEAIGEVYPGDFRERFPPALQDASNPEVAVFAATHALRLRYHMFLQWLADRQLAAAAKGLPLGLYRDLAVGTAFEGAEAWAQASYLVKGVSIGAPPDPFSAQGQIWNLPPLNPLLLAQSNFSPFVEPIAANMRHAGALRIDHAMGLTRLFFVPAGGRPGEGAYVSYPLNDLLGQLALESQRHACLVVGEDLGTVPEGFRERLADCNVLSYRVLWFERDGLKFRPPATYPAKAVACVSTHDLPTLAGWWQAADIEERLSLGLLDAAAAEPARAAREAEKMELVDVLLKARLLTEAPDRAAPLAPSLAAAVHTYVAEAPSALVLAQADDLASETSAVNLPGTDRERPNWRRKLHPDIETLFTGDTARRIMAGVRQVREMS